MDNVEQPAAADVARVRDCLVRAVADIGTTTDLRGRLGAENRAASAKVRAMLRAQW